MNIKKKDDFFRSLIQDLFNNSFSFSSNFSFGEDIENGFPADDDKNFNKTEEVSETDTHTITKYVWTSVDGSMKFSRTTKQSKAQGSIKPSKEDLESQLKTAIAEQNFEEACKLRDQIKLLGQNSKTN